MGNLLKTALLSTVIITSCGVEEESSTSATPEEILETVTTVKTSEDSEVVSIPMDVENTWICLPPSTENLSDINTVWARHLKITKFTTGSYFSDCKEISLDDSIGFDTSMDSSSDFWGSKAKAVVAGFIPCMTWSLTYTFDTEKETATAKSTSYHGSQQQHLICTKY
jgi:hypothetical protein